MLNSGKDIAGRKVIAYADYRYVQPCRRKERGGKLSCTMAMVMGFLVTLEIMVAGAMVLNLDFHGADIIALIMGFAVVYFAVVAVLTDR